MVNNGPSSISQTSLEVSCPLRAQGHGLLHPLELQAEGPIRCSSNQTLNALKLKVRHHARTHTHRQTHTNTHTCVSLGDVECRGDFYTLN